MIKVVEEKRNVWRRNLNLAFVYVAIFVFGLVVVFAMTTILNAKVEEINESTYSVAQQNM